MPGHAVAAGSAVGGLFEGFLGGIERGTQFLERRNDRRRLAERDLAESARQAELDRIDAEDRDLRLRDDAEDRAFRLLEFAEEHPEVRFDPSLLTGGQSAGTAQGPRVGSTRFQTGDSDEVRGEKVGQFRRAVSADLEKRGGLNSGPFGGARPITSDLPRATGLPADTGLPRAVNAPTAGGPSLPRGFVDTGLSSLAELSDERRAAALEQIVNLISSKDPRGDLPGMEGASDLLDFLMEENELGTVFGARGVGGTPRLRSDIVRSGDRNELVNLTSGETIRAFDPIESTVGGSNAIGALLDDIEEDILRARSNAQEFDQDEDAAANAAAQAHGLRDEAHFLELRRGRSQGILGLGGADGGGGSDRQVITQDQAEFLKSKGWTDERINETYTVR